MDTESEAHGAARIELRGLTKYFGANRVLTDVSLSFRPGSVHALLGANGSGKSTIIKILAGYHEPSDGQILINGNPVNFPIGVDELHTAGVRFVHQDLGLVPTLSIRDNLALSTRFEMSSGRINWRRQDENARAMLSTVGIEHLDPRRPVSDLGPIEQTLVAIARSIDGMEEGTGALILDEPTARLPNAQVSELLERCRLLRDRGLALIYVSHRLDEVFALADEVTVLRDGNVIFNDAVAATSPEHLTALITGTSETQTSPPITHPTPQGAEKNTASRLRVRGLSGPRIADIDFDIPAGNIVAVTGLIGSGRSELGRLIYGAQSAHTGDVFLDGEAFVQRDPFASTQRGIGYVPQERSKAGFASLDLVENATLTHVDDFLNGLALSGRQRRAATQQAIVDLDVRPPDPTRVLRELSGGNQQKVILAKWLALDLRLLILDEPTYGVDVGARRLIMDAVVSRARTTGMGVLLLDSDIELVAEYADSVLVMREGLIISRLSGNEITADRIAAASYSIS